MRNSRYAGFPHNGSLEVERRRFLKAGRLASKQIALTALAAATIEAVKFALNAVPNVEGVTLLCAVYGYCLGAGGVVAAIIFCAIETAIFGVGPWVISYFIHWPCVALVFMLLAKSGIKNRWLITLVAAVMTTLFGVQTSLVDTGLFSGFFDRFWYRFSIIYLRGGVFYAVQIVCNLIVFPLLFVPITKILIPAARRAKMCPLPEKGKAEKRAEMSKNLENIPPCDDNGDVDKQNF